MSKSLSLEQLRPVFSLDRRCSAAQRRLATFIDQRAAAALADIAADFQRLRRARGLPPIALTAWRHYTLPPRFQCPECGGRVCIEVDEWSASTGTPAAGGVRVMCVAEEDELDRAMQAGQDPTWEHKHYQGPAWLDLIRRVEKFCASSVRVHAGGSNA